MRKFTRMLLVGAMAALVAGGAVAQDEKKTRPQGGAGGFQRGGAMGGGGMMMDAFTMVASNKVLQEELKISDDQKKKLEDVSKANREKMQDAYKGASRDMTEEQRKEIGEKMTKAREEAKKAVEGVLTSEQAKRANQINYQLMGVRAFSNKDVAEKLKISDDQKEKIKTINDATQKDMRELGGGGRGFGGGQPSEEDRKKMQDNMKKVEAIRKDAEEKIVAVLSDDQKKAWKDMTGEKFDTAKLREGFGGGRQRNDQ